MTGRSAVARGACAATVGISDQQASTFTNPLFAPLKLQGAPLHHALRRAGRARAGSAAWTSGSSTPAPRNQTILISFEHSRTLGQQKTAPTVAAYTKALKTFKKKYPYVKDISPWNEVNRCQAARPQEGQPSAVCTICNGGPSSSPSTTSAARKVFSGVAARSSALDILDEHERRRRGRATCKSFKKVRQAARRSSGASTTTPTPTASRPAARGA